MSHLQNSGRQQSYFTLIFWLQAMGVESDQEIVQLVGSQYIDLMTPSVEECRSQKVRSNSALYW